MADSDNGTTLNGKVNITVDSGQAVNELNKASTSSEDLFKHIEKLEKAFTSMEASIKASTSSIKDFASASSTQNMSAEERLKYEKEITAQKRAQAREAKAETENINQRINLQREKNKGSTWSQQRSTPEYISNKYANDASDRAHNAARDDYMAFNKEYKAMHDRYSSKNIWGNAFNDVGRNLSTSNGMISSLVGNSLQIIGDGLKSPMMGLAAAVSQASSAVTNFASESTKAYGDSQKIQIQMGVVYGSQSQANSAFQGMQNYAIKSPYGIEQTAELSVLLKQSGVYGSELLDTMKMIGDVSSGNNEKMKRIANTYAQIEAIGKASMLDMRQFAYAGIPIYKEVAKQLGVSQTTLRQMISDGKVTSDIMEKVFKNMTSVGGAFYGAVEKGSNALSARLQNLEDIKKLSLASVGEGLYNFGDTKGTGGLYGGVISLEESFYSGIKKWSDDVNLIQNIENSKNNKEEISETIKVISELKKTLGEGNPIVESLIQRIGTLNNAISPDMYRSYIDQSAKNIIEGNESKNTYGKLYNDIQQMMMTIKANPGNYADSKSALSVLGNELKRIQSTQANNYRFGGSLTDEQNIIHKGSLLESAAQAAADSLNKMQSKTDSMTNTLDKYRQAYESSPEYKAALEAKDRQDFNEKLNASNKYRGLMNVDTLGNYVYGKNATLSDIQDFSNNFVSKSEKIKYRWENYFKPEGGLKEGAKEQWASDTGTTIPVLKRIAEDLVKQNTNDPKVRSALTDANKAITYLSSDIGTMNDFMMNNLMAIIEDLSTNLGTVKPVLQDILIKSGMTRGTATLLPFGAKYDALGGMSKIDVEPLWKRIIASVTGLDVSKITGNAYSAMSDYLGFARKNTVGNTLGTMLTSGGYGGTRMNFLDAVNMIQTNGTAYNTVSGNKNDKNKTAYNQIGGPAGPTQQIDWVSMEKDMMQMAMAGKMNSTVVETLKQGYQTQLDTMDKLFVSAITTGEQGQYSADTKQQMLNAFGKFKLDKNAIINGMYNGNAVSLKQTVDQAGNTTWTDTKTNQVFNTLDGIEGAYESLFEFLKQYDKEMAKKVADLANIDIKKVYEENLDKRTLTAQRGLYGAGYGYTQALGSLIDSGMGAQQAADIAKTITENIYTQIQKAVEADKTKVFTDQEITDMVNRETNAQLAENRLAHYRAGIASRYGTIDSNGYSFSKGFLNGIGTTVPENGNTYIEQQYANNHGIQGKMDYATKQGILFQEINNQGLGGELAKHIGLNESSSQDSLQSAISNLPISELDKMTNAIMESDNAAKDLSDTMNSVGSSIGSMSKELAGNMITGTFEQIGESMAKGSDAMDGIGEKMRELGQAALSNLGSLFVQAGLSYIAAHPTWSGLGVGMALIAAGGMASLASGLMTSDTEEDSSDDEVSKLKSIKEQLSDLLEQARSDAIYYENELKHKNALSTDTRLSNTVSGTSVNDAIIAPNGNVITTHPNDYLVATKDPGALINNDSRSSSPNVNISIQNNSGQQLSVTQQKKDNNGNIDIVAVIEQVAGQYIASSKSDDAFSARNYRQQGHVVTA